MRKCTHNIKLFPSQSNLLHKTKIKIIYRPYRRDIKYKGGTDGTAVAVPFMYMEKGDSEFVKKENATFSIGGEEGESKFAVITVTSPMLAKGEYDRVAIKTTAVDSSTVIGSIVAIQTQPRFSE